MQRAAEHEKTVSIHPQAIERFLSFCTQRKIPKKGLILRAGGPTDRLYYLVQGSASVIDSDEDGNEIILAYLNAGDFIGEIGLFYKLKAHTANIRARTACVLAEIEYQNLHQLFNGELREEHSHILQAVGLQLSQRLLQTSRRVTRMAFMDVAGRIARTLLELCAEPDASPHQRGVVLRVSRQEIARIVGCKRETVGRVFKHMEEEQLLATNGMEVIVLNSMLHKDLPN
ncbi:MAG: cyclic nucleotide-binding domain-containing protein [Gammaproteobacteria bacterium]|nr:cyclic nucleotide-binding domain-containing protein [Gammaproteobacteria bacterium]